MVTIVTENEAETAALAEDFAARLRGDECILLSGRLGAGKSVFVRALLRRLCGDSAMDVPSPTFTLAQYYETLIGPAWHFDLYRLKTPSEIDNLGWEEALAGGLVIVEWPERLGTRKPLRSLDIHISAVDNTPHRRSIEMLDLKRTDTV